jgi:hypothetical protein
VAALASPVCVASGFRGALLLSLFDERGGAVAVVSRSMAEPLGVPGESPLLDGRAVLFRAAPRGATFSETVRPARSYVTWQGTIGLHLYPVTASMIVADDIRDLPQSPLATVDGGGAPHRVRPIERSRLAASAGRALSTPRVLLSQRASNTTLPAARALSLRDDVLFGVHNGRLWRVAASRVDDEQPSPSIALPPFAIDGYAPTALHTTQWLSVASGGFAYALYQERVSKSNAMALKLQLTFDTFFTKNVAFFGDPHHEMLQFELDGVWLATQLLPAASNGKPTNRRDGVLIDVVIRSERGKIQGVATTRDGTVLVLYERELFVAGPRLCSGYVWGHSTIDVNNDETALHPRGGQAIDASADAVFVASGEKIDMRRFGVHPRRLIFPRFVTVAHQAHFFQSIINM